MDEDFIDERVGLRDDIAIVAMQELMRAAFQRVFPRTAAADIHDTDGDIAARAYRMADRMIKERKSGLDKLLREIKERGGAGQLNSG
jgi:hypothetical protein